MICKPDEIVIQGINADGKRFRPSDWAERLAGVLSSFGEDHRLAYHRCVHPLIVDGARSVLVDKALKEQNPAVFKFILDFAKDNDLRVVDGGVLVQDAKQTNIECVQDDGILTTLQYFHVDAFIGQGCLGNPAGVCLLSKELSAQEKQRIASELNLPETAFVYSANGQHQLSWFTPNREVDLCGHATLATAHVLLNNIYVEQTQISFQTLSGVLTVKRHRDDLSKLVLDFPARKAQMMECPDGLKEIIGIQPQSVWQAKALMVVLDNEDQVKAVQPDVAALIALTGKPVIFTAKGKQVDFVSRFFSLDLSEDSVTGSAHCTLVPYWADELGKNSLIAQQVSARGGMVYCDYAQDDRVWLAGYARTFMQGNIII
ncbi:PhzF family phenazine biosynthesis isomerase [Neisseria sp. Ec49-e6-T10]|uniref:PhzF family phenazine biosynthesis isomerase n=1 Tax=Neisseria sp. Ec49-e6-T10 TaxID=3140744 RepID=UPI003EC10A73